MNGQGPRRCSRVVSAGCHINDVMNVLFAISIASLVSAGCHINDVMNSHSKCSKHGHVSAGCHINDVMNLCDVFTD